MDDRNRAMSDLRYLRQAGYLSNELRRQTAVLELGGHFAEMTSTFFKVAVAGTGLASLASDFHRFGQNGGHPLRGDHERLVRHVNADVRYGFLDFAQLPEEADQTAADFSNTWLIVYVNAVEEAKAALRELRRAAWDLPTLLAVIGLAGVLVERFENPAAALEAVNAIETGEVLREGDSDLAALAAGAAINDMTLPGVGPRPNQRICFYSLGRPRRIDAPHNARFADLFAEIAAEPPRNHALTGRSLKQLGAGALGNWTGMICGFQSGVAVECLDGDQSIELHNLNRQPLYVADVGSAKAPVWARELQALDPRGTYHGFARMVNHVEDLEPLGDCDALMIAPDNDAARVTGSSAAWEWDILSVQGGTSATGGQMSVQWPGKACLECTTGIRAAAATPVRTQNSCAVAEASVVASNMVIAGLMMSELGEALAGRPTRNLRFHGESTYGNRLGPMVNDAQCAHRSSAGQRRSGGRVTTPS